MRVEDALQAEVDLLAMGEQFIEFHFAKNGAQRRLGELRGLIHVVGDFDHRFVRIDDPQKDDGVDLQGDVVASDDVLRRDFERFLAERDAHHAVHRHEDQDYARTLRRSQQAPEAEDHATLIFRKDLDGTQEVNDEDDDGNRDYGEPKIHCEPPGDFHLRV